MALSWQENIIPAGTTTITLTIEYLQSSHLVFTLNDVGVVPTAVAGSTVLFSPAIGPGTLKVVRTTPRNAVPNVFSNQAEFGESTIDENFKVTKFWAQEDTERSFAGDINTDTINPATPGGAVTIAGVKLQNGSIAATNLGGLLGAALEAPPVIGSRTPNAANFLGVNASGINTQTLTVAVENPTLYYNKLGVAAVNRTYYSKLHDFESVLDTGAIGDGSTDDFQSFAWAHANTAAGKPIYVPGGTYYLSAILECTGRRWILDGATILPDIDRLAGGVVEYHSTDGSTRHGVGRVSSGVHYAFGGSNRGVAGLQIGGGDLRDGPFGVVHFSDGYSGWESTTPSRYPGAIEYAVQPGSVAGTCTTTVGTNIVTSLSGGVFFASLVGKRLYIGNGQIYTIASVIDPTHVTVTYLNGSAVSFASAITATYTVCYCNGSGVCNTSGNTITRVSGDPFIILGNGDDRIVINGVAYGYQSLPDQDHMVLTSSAGTQTNVPYEYWTCVDNLASAIRVHRIAGAGFEENVTIGAYSTGEFHVHAAGGAGRQYPFGLGAGYGNTTGKRWCVTMDGTSGNTLFGGYYDKATLQVDWQETATNWWRMKSGTPGSSSLIPTLTAEGPDGNISVQIAPKGAGLVNMNGIQIQNSAVTAPSPFVKAHVPYNGAGTQYGMSFRPASDNTTSLYFMNAAGGQVGIVSHTGSATTYGTTSDRRTKFDITDLVGSGEFIDALRPRSWRWWIDGSKGAGFVADEFQKVSPESVTGNPDEVWEDGTPKLQSVTYSSGELIANLVAEVQALRKRVAVLEAK